MNTKERYPNKEFRKLVEFINEGKEDKSKSIYENKDIRKVNWKAYNFSQINKIKESLKFINQEVERCFLPPRKAGMPFDVKLYTKIVLLCELFGLDERNAEGFLEIFGYAIGVHEIIDDRVIGNAYNKIEVAFLLKQIFDKRKNSDGVLSGDGTGLETSRRQNYSSNKTTAKEFLTSIVDSREIIQAFDFSGEDECKAMHSLIEEVNGDSLRLDAGFNDRELTRKILEKGMLPYIYPKKINKINGSEAWREMYLEFFYDVIQWLQEYHQRSHSESFHSAFKRKFGILTKIRGHSKFVQVVARIILHNRLRLSYFNKMH